jgi:hypothetical protein
MMSATAFFCSCVILSEGIGGMRLVLPDMEHVPFAAVVVGYCQKTVAAGEPSV